METERRKNWSREEIQYSILKKLLKYTLPVAMSFSSLLMPIQSLAYSDVKPGIWYEEGVNYCTNRNIMTGYADGRFAPDDVMNRAMLVTVLHRIEGKPQSSFINTFKDVPANAYFTDAVRWAAQNRIVTGYDANRFGPEDPVKREQIATILKRYNDYKKIDEGTYNFLQSYEDYGQISPYAIQSLCWAVGNGVISGMSAAKLNPLGSADRSQVATILFRYDSKILQPALDNSQNSDLQKPDPKPEPENPGDSSDNTDPDKTEDPEQNEDSDPDSSSDEENSDSNLDEGEKEEDSNSGSGQDETGDSGNEDNSGEEEQKPQPEPEPSIDLSAQIAQANKYKGLMDGSHDQIVAVTKSGKVRAGGLNTYGQCDVEGWSDIVKVAAGGSHTVGLKSDGTVVATGLNDNGQCNVGGWSGIVDIAAGTNHTVGLKSDGTVVATGSNNYQQCEVSDMKDVKAVIAQDNFTLGLKKNGVVIGDKGFDEDSSRKFKSWRNVVALAAKRGCIAGLTADGKVLGDPDYIHVGKEEDFEPFNNIKAIACSYNSFFGLKTDGSIVQLGHKKDVTNWSDKIAVYSTDNYCVLGLKADGSIEMAGYLSYDVKPKCDFTDWTDIGLPEN